MLSNFGAVIAAFFPFLLTLGVANTAKKGVVATISYHFILCWCSCFGNYSLFTIFRVHEYDPETYARYHGIKESDNKEGGGWIELLKKAQKYFWQVSLVNFSAGFHSIPFNLRNWCDCAKRMEHHFRSSAGYQIAGNWFGIDCCSINCGCNLVMFWLSTKQSSQVRLRLKFAIRCNWLHFNFLGSFTNADSFIHFNRNQLGGMNTYPLTMVSNALSGKHMGTYLRFIQLFNLFATDCRFITQLYHLPNGRQLNAS